MKHILALHLLLGGDRLPGTRAAMVRTEAHNKTIRCLLTLEVEHQAMEPLELGRVTCNLRDRWAPLAHIHQVNILLSRIELLLAGLRPEARSP